MMPPIMAELGGNADSFLKTITKAISSLDGLGKAAKLAADACDAAFASLSAGVEALAGVAESATAAKTAMQGLSRASNAVAASSKKAATAAGTAMGTIAESTERMAASVEAATTTAATGIAGIGVEARTAATETSAAARAAAAGTETASAGILGTFTKVGKATAILGVGVGAESIKMAAEFNASTNVLVTAAGELPANLGKVRDGIKTIATQTGTSWQQLTEGMYDAEKAGFSYAKGGLDIVKAAAQGAREENAPLADVVGALTTVMKNYHLPASQAVEVTNAMKTAAGEAKATFGQFSTALPTVLPAAYSAKISFADVAGSLATMTQHGETARHSAQLMNSTIKALSSANGPAVSTLNQLGLTSQQVSKDLGTQGLSGTLNDIVDAIQKKMGPSGLYAAGVFKNSAQAASSLQSMLGGMSGGLKTASQGFLDGKMSAGDYTKYIKGLGAEGFATGTQFKALATKASGFSDGVKSGNGSLSTFQDLLKKATGGASGMQTALLLTGKNSKDTAANIGKVNKSLHDSTPDVEGWASTAKQLSVQLSQMKQVVETMAISLGQKLIPPLSAVLGYFIQHKAAASALGAIIGGLLTLSFVAFAVKGIGKVLGALKTLGSTFVSMARGAAQFVKGLAGADLGEDAGGAAKFGTALRSGGSAVASGVSNGASAVASGTSSAAGAVADLASAGWDKLKGATSAVKDLASAGWSKIASGASSAAQGIRTAATAAAEYATKAATATLAAVRQAAAWVAEKVALVASAVAEKAAAAAEWLLNVAMDANPIMLVVLAVAAVIGALVLAYAKVGWFRDAVNACFKAVGVAVSWIVDFVKAHWPLLLAILTGPIGIAVLLITRYWKQISSGFEDAWRAVESAAKTALAWVSGLPGKILAGLGHLNNLLAGAGRDIISGLLHGIENAASGMLSYVSGLASKVSGAFKSVLHILSPSRVFAEHGQFIVAGLVQGLQAGESSAVEQSRSLAQSVSGTFSDELGISSPSKTFRSLGAYVIDGLVQGLTGSTASVKAATKRITDQMYVDFGDSHKGLQQYVGRENNALLSLADKRDSVATKLKAANKNLATLQKDYAAEQKSVADSIMQSNSVVMATPDDGSTLTSNDLITNMQQQMQATLQFAANLKAAQKAGLSSALVQQIASSGVASGGATAAALATATKGQIQQLNSMQKNTQTAANSVGTSVANSMYGAGIKSAQGLVKGLQSQEKAIEAQMLKIAKSMQAAIKKALGIHSPSQVFADLGVFIPQGLAAGIQTGTKHATGAVMTMSKAVATAGSNRSLAYASGSGASGVTQVINVNVTVEGNVTSEKKLAENVRAILLRKGSVNPQTWPNFKR